MENMKVCFPVSAQKWYNKKTHLPINSGEINSEQEPDVTEKKAKDETVLGLDGVPILNGETTLAS